MNSLDTSAVKLGALSDYMSLGVPCLANHFCKSNLDVLNASYTSWLSKFQKVVENYHVHCIMLKKLF